MVNPIISIIIPVYNASRYLANCLDSILSYKGNEIEVIVINDGSTDGSDNIISQYATDDKRIKAFNQKNKGVSSARNRGLETSLGNWIWFVDADDCVVTENIPYLITAIKTYDCDTVFTGLINVYSNGIVIEDNVFLDITSSKNDILSKKIAFQNGMILFSKRIIIDNKIEFSQDIKIGEDLEFQYKYLIACEHPICIDRCLYKYYRRPGSAMLNSNSYIYNCNDNITILRNLYDIIVKRKIVNSTWLSLRIKLLIKAGLVSASNLNKNKRQIYIRDMRELLRKFSSIGYATIKDKTIRLACLFPAIYFHIVQKRLSNS